MESKHCPPFRVLIAGASVAGLSLALCLEKAGIDYLVLEKRTDLFPQLGASIGLHPHGLRIFDQLDMLESLEKLASPLLEGKHFDTKGRLFSTARLHGNVYQQTGYPIIFIQRRQLLVALHAHIVNKSNILTGHQVVSYRETDDKVIVTTSDGSEHEGDIFVGADGIHSTVRKLMWQTVAKEQNSTVEEIEEHFTCRWKSLFAISKTSSSICPVPQGTVYNSYHKRYSTVAAHSVPGTNFMFFYARIPPTQTPHTPRYKEEDVSAILEQYGDTKMCTDFTVKDVWDNRTAGGLVPLEEGIMKRWSHGRVVCVGDAIHKVTINAGLGGNTALEGVVTLTNNLRALLKNEALSSPPTTEQISAAFAEYDRQHRPRAELVHNVSTGLTALEAQDTFTDWLASEWIVPNVPEWLKVRLYVGFSRGGTALDFIPVKPERVVQLDKLNTSSNGLRTAVFLISATVAAVGAGLWSSGSAVPLFG